MKLMIYDIVALRVTSMTFGVQVLNCFSMLLRIANLFGFRQKLAVTKFTKKNGD